MMVHCGLRLQVDRDGLGVKKVRQSSMWLRPRSLLPPVPAPLWLLLLLFLLLECSTMPLSPPHAGDSGSPPLPIILPLRTLASMMCCSAVSLTIASPSHGKLGQSGSYFRNSSTTSRHQCLACDMVVDSGMQPQWYACVCCIDIHAHVHVPA